MGPYSIWFGNLVEMTVQGPHLCNPQHFEIFFYCNTTGYRPGPWDIIFMYIQYEDFLPLKGTLYLL
jgi:hypothetical protein